MNLWFAKYLVAITRYGFMTLIYGKEVSKKNGTVIKVSLLLMMDTISHIRSEESIMHWQKREEKKLNAFQRKYPKKGSFASITFEQQGKLNTNEQKKTTKVISFGCYKLHMKCLKDLGILITQSILKYFVANSSWSCLFFIRFYWFRNNTFMNDFDSK